MKQDIHPSLELENINQIFSSIKKVDNKDGMIYVDNTETFP